MAYRISRITSWTSLLLAIFVFATPSSGQDNLEFDKIGMQPHRDYLQLQPFERLDTQSGNLILTLNDLTLNGNAGSSLRFQLTYNANSDDARGPWRFGIAGVPMRVLQEQAYGASGIFIENTVANTRHITPILEMADGAQRGTVFAHTPDSDDHSTMYEVLTSGFWKYNRNVHVLNMPDGTNCTYVHISGDPGDTYRLLQIDDQFGNVTTLTWSTGELDVQQVFDGEGTRLVHLEMNDVTGLPMSMTFNDGLNDRVWEYEYEGGVDDTTGRLTQTTPPAGPGWHFEYHDVDGLPFQRLTELTTPQGGRIDYGYEVRHFFAEGPEITRAFLISRDMLDRDATESMGHWIINCHWYSGSTYCDPTTIETPSALLTYSYGPVLYAPAAHPQTLIDGHIGLTHVTVQAPAGGTPLDEESRSYVELEVVSPGSAVFRSAELSERVIERAGLTYTTTLTYGTSDHSDYHHPTLVTEAGDLVRTTAWTYAHPQTADRLIVGLPATETVTVGSETWKRSWEYNGDTGFKELEREFADPAVDGYATEFEEDGHGNVSSVTDENDHMTTHAYAWGQVETTTTPLYVVEREINFDGSVAWVRQAGRTTTFTYDAAGRLHTTEPPGTSNSTAIDYDDDGDATWVRTTRGGVQTTTTVDGFGRPIETVNDTLGIHQRTEYDAEGRVTYEGYPFTGAADKGTTITYDVLGRVTRRTNPDEHFSQRTYGAGMDGATVDLVDENNHTTVQTWTAFGDPDQARLTELADADAQTWHYAYHALGQLSTVTSPDSLQRIWLYNTKNRLSSESHPESGTTTYSGYDDAGNLTDKTDAKGTAFHFEYDDNGRLTSSSAGTHTTTIAYEPGSDRRLSASDGVVTTGFTYDTAGRPTRRQQAIGAYVFNTDYQYDSNDNITEITYPTGRKIGYDVTANQITGVFETAAGRDYAFGMTYHPSGGLHTLTRGDATSTTTTIGYDADRYWVQSISSGALQLTYDDYDWVGNVGSIGDSRSGMGQTFTYDSLDRLLTSTSSGYASTTYAYDVHGNRQTAAGTTYSYQTGSLRMTQQGTNTFGYDSNGNLTGITGTPTATYAYTPENWLSSATAGGVTTNYAYDADGWRARKSTSTQTTLYLRGLNGELLTEWENPGPSGHVRDYVYAGSRLLAAVDKTSTTSPTTCGGNVWPDGSSQSVSIATSGGTATTGFDGSACRQISIELTTTSGSFGCPTISVLKPDSATLFAWSSSCVSSIFIDPAVLTNSGPYSLVVDPSGTNTGAGTVRIHDVVHIQTPVVANGSAATATSTTPGQNFKFQFDGVANHRYTFLAEQLSGTCLLNTVTVLNPNGTTLGSGGTCVATWLFEPPATTATGVFTIVIDPPLANVGSVRVTLYDVADIVDSVTPNGAAVTKQFTTPGQNLKLTFSGTANHRYAFLAEQLSGNCLFLTVTVLNPNGTPLGSGGNCAATPFFEPPVPNATGTFTIIIDPPSANLGEVRVTLYDEVDVTGSVTINGGTVPVSLTTPGQMGKLTFTISSTTQVTVRLTGNTMGFTNVRLLRPDGNEQTSNANSLGSFNLAQQTLTTTGTYTVEVDPSGTSTGSINVEVTSP